MPRPTKPKTTTKSKATTVLVTGGAGFIGSQLSDRLVAEGHRVVVIDNLSYGKRAYVPKEAKFYEMDVLDPKLGDVFKKEKPEFVFHLAAQIDVRVSVDRPIHDAEINIHGSLRVMEACVKSGVKKLIFASSGGAIYHGLDIRPTPENVPCMPLSPYGVAKLAFELYLHAGCHNYGLKYVALRYANVYGPRQDSKGEAGVIGIFTKMMLAGAAPTIFGDGKQTRDFVYVADVVEANILAMRSPHVGVFNIGTGKQTSVNELEALIREESGLKTKSKRAAARTGEERFSALDASAARAALGWKPKVDIKEGIRKTVAWFKAKR
jgi:UDP-glucose 4-epimerase